MLSDEELELMEAIVMAECGICSQETQVHITNVIANRVLSNRYPNSLYDVVFQKWQFSPTFDGSLYRYEPTEQVKESVQLAIQGDDTTNGCLGFLNIGLSTQSNVDNILMWNDVVFEIDDVSFTKPKE